MDNLFTPFFTTKPVGEGTGLGLPFAYGAIKMHSGQLTVESNADTANGPVGTRIRIVLPRARPDLSKVIIDGD
jgi:signal transduction histidine kinase